MGDDPSSCERTIYAGGWNRGLIRGQRYRAPACNDLAPNAVEYVLHNYTKHLKKRGKMPHPWDIDPYSSMSGRAVTFWLDYDSGTPIVATPRTWLLRRAVGAT